MGRDKALLPASVRQSLLEHQLTLLAAVGPAERLVSARCGQLLPLPSGVRVVRDDGAAGPLGGLVALLRAVRTERVLILGVDVGGMQSWMLRRLLGAVDGVATGVIPQTARMPQPLAAVWPRAMLPLAVEQLAAGSDLSLRTLVARGVEAGLLRLHDMPACDARFFANCNRPLEWAALVNRFAGVRVGPTRT